MIDKIPRLLIPAYYSEGFMNRDPGTIIHFVTKQLLEYPPLNVKYQIYSNKIMGSVNNLLPFLFHEYFYYSND